MSSEEKKGKEKKCKNKINVKVLSMIDTGATSTVVRSDIIEKIGISPIEDVKIDMPLIIAKMLTNKLRKRGQATLKHKLQDAGYFF